MFKGAISYAFDEVSKFLYAIIFILIATKDLGGTSPFEYEKLTHWLVVTVMGMLLRDWLYTISWTFDNLKSLTKTHPLFGKLWVVGQEDALTRREIVRIMTMVIVFLLASPLIGFICIYYPFKILEFTNVLLETL